MGVRTPVAWGLRKQLEILQKYGYTVVTVAELLQESPFADVGRDDPLFPALRELAETRAVAYDDNTLRLDRVMTWGELALLLCPREISLERRRGRIREKGRAAPDWGAVDWCIEKRLLLPEQRADLPVTALPEAYFDTPQDFTRRSVYTALKKLLE